MSNIFKYQDFINEGKLFLHPTFWESIVSIKDNDSSDPSVRKIAKILYSIEGVDIDKMEIGAVGFSDNPKTLKFKTFKKLKKELSDRGSDLYNSLNIRDTRVYISSILANSKDEVKMGRIIRKILVSSGEDGFSDSDIENFVNVLKTEFKKKDDAFDNFELVSGDDINKYYLSEYYTKSNGNLKGTLGSSCMRYNYRNDYMNFYSINSDVVKLLIYRDPNEDDSILGRALVWEGIDQDTNDNIIFMDRVYSVEDSDVNLFKEYALKNKWIYKDHNNSSEDFSFNGDDKTIRVHIKAGRYESYPYLDTLVYYDFVNGVLSNYNNTHLNIINLEGTEGKHNCYECDGNGEMECENCSGDESITCEDCWGSGQSECQDCWGSGVIGCEECDGDGYSDCSGCDGEGCEECSDSGSIDCEECSGEGGIMCGECDGDGEIMCGECSGDGEIMCWECSDGTSHCSEESCIEHNNFPIVR